MPIAPDLKDLIEQRLLVYPVSFEPLELSPDGEWLLAARAGRRYPIRDGVPALDPEEAEPRTATTDP